ncbi:hypothetical protein ERJ75_001165200 [Trypanosoma vivax]|nr:hypothetical protein TRVL_02012 [Trypanosoma vivax]KAH8609791.1 hypothetical protein ERJ75_001165200 [Trypanosoma vivax]
MTAGRHAKNIVAQDARSHAALPRCTKTGGSVRVALKQGTVARTRRGEALAPGQQTAKWFAKSISLAKATQTATSEKLGPNVGSRGPNGCDDGGALQTRPRLRDRRRTTRGMAS